jgi:magnesium transporter
MTPTTTVCDHERPTRIPTAPSEALIALSDDGDQFLWVDLDCPTPTEFGKIVGELGLSDLDFDDLTRQRSRHTVDRSGETMIFTLKALRRDRKDNEPALDNSQVVVCVAPRLVLTLHQGSGALFTEVHQQVHGRPENLAAGPFALAQIVCEEVIAEYDRIAHDIESDIIEVEHEVFDLHTPDPLDAIYTLKREVLFFRRIEDPLHSVLADLARGRIQVPTGMRDRFQQTLQDLDRVDNTIDSLNELITSILQAHLAQVAVQQNTDMRRISSWAAIVAVPTMIAGLYGMNFSYMPELDWVVGYPLTVAVMLAACFVVYRGLKKSGWL